MSTAKTSARSQLDRFLSETKPPVNDLSERDKNASQTLATRHDALNQSLNEAELHLRLLKPLHPVWVDYNHEPRTSEPANWEVLGIAKHKDKWRICHGFGDESEGCISDVKPISECPVDIRVRAAGQVRKLREAIVKAKEDYIPKVDEAIKELDDLCLEMA